MDPKLKVTILNLFSRTGNDYSLAVNSTEFLCQFVHLRFYMLQVKAIIDVIKFLYCYLYHMIKSIILGIIAQLK